MKKKIRIGNASGYWVDDLTVEKVKKFFTGITFGKVIRYELENLHELNFLLEETLGGDQVADD